MSEFDPHTNTHVQAQVYRIVFLYTICECAHMFALNPTAVY